MTPGPEALNDALHDFVESLDPQQDDPDRCRALYALFSNYSRYQNHEKALEHLRLLEAMGDLSEHWPGAIASCLFWELNDMGETERHVLRRLESCVDDPRWKCNWQCYLLAVYARRGESGDVIEDLVKHISKYVLHKYYYSRVLMEAMRLLIPKGFVSFRGHYILESAWAEKAGPPKFRGMPEDKPAYPRRLNALQRTLLPPMPPLRYDLIEMAKRGEL